MNTTDEGFSFSFHKNYKLGPTYPRHAIFSLRELHQTSPSALRAETSSRYQSDPPENQIWHTDEAGASLACYQSTLISGTSFFSQLYFPSSGRSTNEILWEIFTSSPFLCPSRPRRSLARSRENRFARPNRRACSQAKETGISRLLREFHAFYHSLVKKLRWRWKTCQTHLASISRVYKYLLSKQWFYTISGPLLHIKSVNMHKWNIFLIEALSMLASPQIKTVKPPDKKPDISDRSSFLGRRSVKFQFVWQKLSYNITLAGLPQKYVGLQDSSAKYQKSFVCLRKMCLMEVFWKRTFYRNDDLSVSVT